VIGLELTGRSLTLMLSKVCEHPAPGSAMTVVGSLPWSTAPLHPTLTTAAAPAAVLQVFRLLVC
jgi:hypothetical protein